MPASPTGVFNLVTGPGETVGAELEENAGIDGLVFTGSYEVGMQLYRCFTQDYPRPIITEMGGKNPAIVTRHADLDEAAEGVMRSAFGFDGQKCTANSRVYVERPVAREFVDRLVEKARAIRTAIRPSRENWMGPVINQRALTSSPMQSTRRRPTVARSRSAARSATDERGYFPTPTVVTGLPLEHRLFRDELFVPFLVVGEVDSLDQALDEANDSRLRPDGGDLQPRPGRGPALPRHHPGRRRVREPPRRRHDRGLAGDPELRRLEGIGLVRQERARPVLRPAVPARAVADRRRR